MQKNASKNVAIKKGEMFVCSKDRFFESFLYKGISSYLFFRVICVKCIVGCLKSGLLAKELF